MALSWRSILTFPLVIGLFAILGGVFGPGTEGVSAASSGPEEEMKSSLKAFTKVYDVVEANFADKITSDKGIYKGAIPGMLRTLDPHSNFFDPKDFGALRDDQRGHYFGVGMTVGPRNGKTIVIAPFGGSPAYKAGIRPGDAILEVNDKRTDSLSTSSPSRGMTVNWFVLAIGSRRNQRGMKPSGSGGFSGVVGLVSVGQETEEVPGAAKAMVKCVDGGKNHQRRYVVWEGLLSTATDRRPQTSAQLIFGKTDSTSGPPGGGIPPRV